MSQRVLFVGGPGNISESTVRDLLERGDEVAILTRTKKAWPDLEKQVRFFRGNRSEAGQVEAAVREFRPDVVADFVCYQPEEAEDAVRAAAGRVAQYIFVSTVDVYGYPLSRLPMREDDPWGDLRTDYAAAKVRCEEAFRRASEAGQLPLTVARPTYSFGHSFVLGFLTFDGGRLLIPRIRAGRPILVPSCGNTLIHVSLAWNTGRMIARLVGHAPAIGRNFTVGHDTFMTHDDYARLLGRAAGREPRLVHVPHDLLLAMPGDEIRQGPVGILLQFNLAFSVEAFRAEFPDFRWEPTLDEGMRRYVAGHEQEAFFADPAQEILDDRVIRLWQERTRQFAL